VPHVLVNAVLFQVLWFTAILTGWFWAIGPLVLLITHFLVVEKRTKVRLSCLGLAVAGMFADSALLYGGIYSFPEGTLYIPGMLPLWLSYMWIGFCFCLPISLSWLFRSSWLLVAFFTVGGPLSYLAGNRLGALDFANSSLWILAAMWFALAVLVLVVRKYSAEAKVSTSGSALI
jgi:hypothetical protein